MTEDKDLARAEDIVSNTVDLAVGQAGNLIADFAEALREERQRILNEVLAIFTKEHPCYKKGHAAGFDGNCWAAGKIESLLKENGADNG